MNKTVVALRALGDSQQLLDVDAIVRTAQHAAASRGVDRCAIDLPADDSLYEKLGRRPSFTAGWQVAGHLWHEGELAPSLLGDGFEQADTWRVHEYTAWDHAPEAYDGCPSLGVKQISFVGKRPDLTDEEFVTNYRAHVDVARIHHAGVRKYQQNIVTRNAGEGASIIAGISEFWFRSVDDLINRYYAFENSSAVTRADSANFLDPVTTTWMLVQEYWIHR
jgi:hypothetical protein